MRKRMRVPGAVAVLAAATVLLSGCVTSARAVPTATPQQVAPSITVATETPITTLNTSTAGGSGDLAALTRSGFMTVGPRGQLVPNTRFGSVQKLSDDPLTVKYTVNRSVTWSDGVPVGAADLLLAWAASISRNNGGAVDFGSVDAGSALDGVTRTPQVSDDDRSLTLVYDRPTVDWQLAMEPGVPAHVVYALSRSGTATGRAAQRAMESVLAGGDRAALGRIATAWRSGFTVQGLPRDRRLLVSDGPYRVTDLVQGQYAVLTASTGYRGGPRPKTAEIVLRSIGANLDRRDALQNGQVQVTPVDATATSLASVRRVRSVQARAYPTSAFEHLDLTLGNRGPFDAASYRGNARTALAVRRAFLRAVPRQQMLDRLIKPVLPDAVLLDSALLLPGQAGYAASAAGNGSAGYRDVDIAGARRLLAAAKLTAPVVVRLAYPTDDPRRRAEFRLIRDSAAKAGFQVVDAGRPAARFFDPKTGIGTRGYAYDACVFAYRLNSPSALQSEPNTRTGSPYNYQGYRDPAVDRLWDRVAAAPDLAAAVPLQQQIDAHLIGDAATLPLFQLPAAVAWHDGVTGVSGALYPPNALASFPAWVRRT